MSEEVLVFIALGSNLDPVWNILRCLELLQQLPTTRVWNQSSWYYTRPWGEVAQPNFINLVIGLYTCLTPWELLAATQSIEHYLQRTRTMQNGPRTIDLDILLYDKLILCEPNLKIPHSGLLIRDFMLLPLIEIAPCTIHPECGHPVCDLTNEMKAHQTILLIKKPASLFNYNFLILK